MKNSILIIGIDGLSWDVLMPGINKGKLPTFSKLLKKGSWGKLKTTIPPLSCSAWTSLFTGKNPGKHGIYEYTTDLGELINSRSIKVQKIWQILSFYNKRCCVINVPMTYPVERINGYMVSDALTPPQEKIYSYPPELMSVLEKHRYEIRVRYGRHKSLPDQDYIIEKRFSFLKKLYNILEKRYNTLKELMNEHWDFFMFVFDHETAMLQHLFFDRKDILLEFFTKMDFCINDLIKTFSAKNTNPYIFIVSDHGFSSSPTRTFNIRAWLEKRGISEDNRSILHKIVPKTYRKLNKLYLSELIFLFNKAYKAKENFQRRLATSSNVYYKYPGVYIRQDKINKHGYEALRDKLILELKQLKDPLTHEKIFQIVEKREEIYYGSYSEYAPDIIAISKSKYNVISSYDSNTLFDDIKMHLRGKHFSDIYGMFLAYGNGINACLIKNASILDIFPTVLHILDVPLPKDLDGKVLKNIFKKDSYFFNKKIICSKTEIKTLQEKDNIKNILQDVKL